MPATRKAVSYKRLLELETQLQVEVEELFALSEQSEQPEALDGLVMSKEIARRQDRLVRLAKAKAVLEARAKERVAAEQVEYEAKLAQREERERTTGRRPGGRPPTPPTEGPHDGDQYNFTDPQSRIMKSPTRAGFEQDVRRIGSEDRVQRRLRELMERSLHTPLTLTLKRGRRPEHVEKAA